MPNKLYCFCLALGSPALTSCHGNIGWTSLCKCQAISSNYQATTGTCKTRGRRENPKDKKGIDNNVLSMKSIGQYFLLFNFSRNTYMSQGTCMHVDANVVEVEDLLLNLMKYRLLVLQPFCKTHLNSKFAVLNDVIMIINSRINIAYFLNDRQTLDVTSLPGQVTSTDTVLMGHTTT